MEALKGFRILGARGVGLGGNTGKGELRMVSMDARKDLLPHSKDRKEEREGPLWFFRGRLSCVYNSSTYARQIRKTLDILELGVVYLEENK